jgi:Uncharacterised nucleotidyltransferase
VCKGSGAPRIVPHPRFHPKLYGEIAISSRVLRILVGWLKMVSRSGQSTAEPDRLADLIEPREFRFLLSCARSEPRTGIRREVDKDLDWKTLLRFAERHGVQPLLNQALKSTCWDRVPQTTRFELQRFNRANVQKNLLFTAELLQLLAEFERNRISIITFKGPVLAEAVYGDLSLREFSDLDVLVHEADLRKAEDILIARGYLADFPDEDYRKAFLSYQGQYAFRHRQTGAAVDLHWQLSSKGVVFPLRSAEVWSRVEHVMIGGRKVPTFAKADLALFLAAHGTKEGWRRLNWVCDFAELLRKYRHIDWSEVFERAHRAHSSRSLLLAIFLAVTLLEAPAPVDLIERARNNPAIRALADKARLRMLSMAQQGELEEFIGGLDTHDKLRHRLWPIATLLVTRTVGDYRTMPLPKSLWGIYYVTRPFRLASKAARMMCR